MIDLAVPAIIAAVLAAAAGYRAGKRRKYVVPQLPPDHTAQLDVLGILLSCPRGINEDDRAYAIRLIAKAHLHQQDRS